jgi:hypothetical protein
MKAASHTYMYKDIIYICIYIYILNKGSLEVKLPTIWTDEKQRWAESEKRREEKKERRSKRKAPKKEDPGARKARKVVKSFVFPPMTYSHHN